MNAQVPPAPPRRSWVRPLLWICATLLLLLLLGIAAVVGLGYMGWKAVNRAAEPYVSTYRQLAGAEGLDGLLAGQDLEALAAQLPEADRQRLEAALAGLPGADGGGLKLDGTASQAQLMQQLLDLQSGQGLQALDPRQRRELEGAVAALGQVLQQHSAAQGSAEAAALAALARQLSAAAARPADQGGEAAEAGGAAEDAPAPAP